MAAVQYVAGHFDSVSPLQFLTVPAMIIIIVLSMRPVADCSLCCGILEVIALYTRNNRFRDGKKDTRLREHCGE